MNTPRAHQSSAHLGAQLALVSAVRALLADGGTRPTHPSPLAIAPGGTIAVLRTINRDGRATRELLREVTAQAGVRLLDITPAPAFGAIPHMHRVSLVVATTPTLAVAAERCAAAWRAPVILPDAITRPSGPARLLMRPEPTLTLELENGRTDAVVQSLHITDALRYAVPCHRASPVDGFLARPTPSGMLTCAMSETITQVRLITGPVRLYVPTPTMCVVDGQPYACPAGVHRIEVARSPLYRIFTS